MTTFATNFLNVQGLSTTLPPKTRKRKEKKKKKRKGYVHPSRNYTSRRYDPRFRRVVVGRRDKASGEFAQDPGCAVEEDVGDYACDDAVGDARKKKREERKRECE